VELDDQRQVPVLNPLPGDDRPYEPPTLFVRNPGSQTSEHSMSRSVQAWLWPLPDGDELTMTLEWPDMDLPPTVYRIDLAPVRAAAARSIPFWP
jgi:hypothetical protein